MREKERNKERERGREIERRARLFVALGGGLFVVCCSLLLRGVCLFVGSLEGGRGGYASDRCRGLILGYS